MSRYLFSFKFSCKRCLLKYLLEGLKKCLYLKKFTLYEYIHIYNYLQIYVDTLYGQPIHISTHTRIKFDCQVDSYLLGYEIPVPPSLSQESRGWEHPLPEAARGGRGERAGLKTR
jgi:hypothetical protein